MGASQLAKHTRGRVSEHELTFTNRRHTDILANALMLQNVADLTEALEKLKQSGYSINEEDVAHLSPYLTRHIQRFGDYFFKTWHETPFPLEEEVYSA